MAEHLMNDSNRSFMSAALVASELYRAKTIAQELSITSKNARALAVRAGSTAAGFNEITNFIEGLAKITIDTANQVNAKAVKLTQLASSLFRTFDLLSRLKKSAEQASDFDAHSLSHLIHITQKKVEKTQQASQKQATQLRLQLNETRRELRAAKIVTVVARVESARAEIKMQDALNAVADRVADASERINRHIYTALKTLQQEMD